MISKKTINIAVKRLAEKFRPERVILFGSFARGTADDYSDVDLLIITSKKKNKRMTLMTEMDKVLWGLGMARDIVILTAEEYDEERDIPGTIARYASKDGKILYEESK